ncbi:hypothetical protein JB92DRAFT_2972398 [Gautieria morchelliformis]|nr:hypothetical protein JB92DRAFT_2972398 [Gautieria morchelliformis]
MIQANLARLNLPHPEAVFDICFFRANPLPFYPHSFIQVSKFIARHGDASAVEVATSPTP